MTPFFAHHRHRLLICAWGAALASQAGAAEPATPTTAASGSAAASAPKADIEATSASDAKSVGDKVREALGVSILPNKKFTVVVGNKSGSTSGGSSGGHAATQGEPVARGADAPMRMPAVMGSAAPAHYAQGARSARTHTAKTPSHSAEAHWAYEGETGPQAWGQLKPDFNLCAIGKRQSPIHIEDGNTLQGPAEPIAFEYSASNATVVNNGHTIQVDVQGENSIAVRGSTYRLLQFHFHTPSEEQVNYKRYPMVAHLVHRNIEGQLAVVAVLLDMGEPNSAIDQVWTYMPLDAGDRVRMPAGLLNLKELLPTDQRYYQFMGSLTTPPCSEGVLWMVLKQPVTISKAQYKLFTQLYPNNARPVQSLNGRPVREAQ
jgi:carbonic anhydrase